MQEMLAIKYISFIHVLYNTKRYFIRNKIFIIVLAASLSLYFLQERNMFPINKFIHFRIEPLQKKKENIKANRSTTWDVRNRLPATSIHI